MSSEAGAGNSHLSRIETLWSVVHRAHLSEPAAATAAQQQLLELYGGAIRRYLIASLGDQDLADEVFQDFALKFVKGSFRDVDPGKGRFRSFVKSVLYRMIADVYRQRASQRKRLRLSEPVNSRLPQNMNDEDETFLLSWREEILDRTWQALADHESTTGVPYNRVLRLRVAQPALSSEAFAVKISQLLGKSTSPGSARVLVHRARDKFANLLIDVIGQSLADNRHESIEAELIELRLMAYCRDTFMARKEN